MSGIANAAASAAEKHYGRPRVVESEIVSPGNAGSVFNPVVWAEFRRWRARPMAYLGIVLLTSLGIGYLYSAHDDLIRSIGASPIGTGALNPYLSYIDYIIRLIIRPSTILPLLMVWRALVSFRGDGFYRPFRTTFISANGFLWGVVAVPVVLSAVILVAYTGWVLSPSIFRDYFARPEPLRYVHPYWQVMAILFEGGLNGAAVAMITLYFGVRGRGKLLALLPVVYTILMMQGAHAWMYTNSGLFYRMIERFPLAWAETFGFWGKHFGWPSTMTMSVVTMAEHIHQPLRALWPYLLSGIPKFFLCLFMWGITRLCVESRED